MHYAPRRLREERELRLAAADDIRSLREKRPEIVGRKISPLSPPRFPVENEAYEFLHPPLDADVMSETRALVREMERRGTLFGVTVRMVAAIGIAAIIALFFVVMVPTARQPDSMQSFFAAGQSSTAALTQRSERRRPEAGTCRIPFAAGVRRHRTSRRTRATGKGIRQDPSAVSAVASEGKPERIGSITAPQQTITTNKINGGRQRNVLSVV